ncbi:MAG: hypothetical protein V3V95_05570 [Thermodesulfobacteriota bacterium]
MRGSILKRSYSLILLAALVLSCPAPVSSAPLDPDSARCIDCHESYVDGALPGRVCHSAGCNHPVGLDYAGLAADNPGYNNAELLDPAMKLTGGVMGCTTCHVPKHKPMTTGSGDPLLSVDNRGSALCLQCHIK